MLKRIVIASTVTALVVSGVAFAATPGVGTVVTLHKTHLGKVLATSTGRTLYLSTGDDKNKSHCGGSCLTYWLPLLTTGKPVAGSGVRQPLLRRIWRSDGSRQVTYNGHPLYRYAGDTQPGQTNGEGLASHWFVVSAAGKRK